jgi:hypothetical protein
MKRRTSHKITVCGSFQPVEAMPVRSGTGFGREQMVLTPYKCPGIPVCPPHVNLEIPDVDDEPDNVPDGPW